MTISIQPTRLYCKKQLELTGVDEFFLGYFLFPYALQPGATIAELKPVMAQRSGQATGHKGVEKMKRGRTHNEHVLNDMGGVFALPAEAANAEYFTLLVGGYEKSRTGSSIYGQFESGELHSIPTSKYPDLKNFGLALAGEMVRLATNPNGYQPDAATVKALLKSLGAYVFTTLFKDASIDFEPVIFTKAELLERPVHHTVVLDAQGVHYELDLRISAV